MDDAIQFKVGDTVSVLKARTMFVGAEAPNS